MLQILKKSLFLIFFQKSSRVQNFELKNCKLGFSKQSHSLKFQEVGRCVRGKNRNSNFVSTERVSIQNKYNHYKHKYWYCRALDKREYLMIIRDNFC